MNVTWCKQLTDASLREVAARCPQLRHLDVAYCGKLTDASLREVAAHCLQLQHLESLVECPMSRYEKVSMNAVFIV